MGFDSKCDFAPPTILVGLLLYPWTWGISSESLQRLPSCWGNSWKTIEAEGEKERYKHLNAEFQRIPRGDKKAFLSDQCKEIEENNKMGKTRDRKKIRDTKGTFHAKMGTIKDRNGS